MEQSTLTIQARLNCSENQLQCDLEPRTIPFLDGGLLCDNLDSRKRRTHIHVVLVII